jgi:Mg-chelatase subunit ChlD
VEESAFTRAMALDADRAVGLLADMAAATDPALRAASRRMASRLLPPLGRVEPLRHRAPRRLVSRRGVADGDLDLDRTLERSGGIRPRDPAQLVTRAFAAGPRAVCLLVDRSGSMSGQAVAVAAVAAAAVVQAASDRLRCGVIAFATDTMVLRHLRSATPAEWVIEDLLSLRGHGTTDLARALRAAAAELEHVPQASRTAILLSDCIYTKGGDPLVPAGAIDRLHVLGTSRDPDAVAAGRALARRGHGRWLPATSLTELARNLQTVLDTAG